MFDPFSTGSDVTPSDFCTWDPSICSGGGAPGGYSQDSWGSVNPTPTPAPFNWGPASTGITKILGGVAGIVQAGQGRGGPYGGPYGSGPYGAVGYGASPLGGISGGISGTTLLVVVAIAAVFMLGRK